MDIVYGGWDFQTHVWDMPFAYNRQHVPWPTFGGNNKRDGVVFPLALVGVEDRDLVPAAGFTVSESVPEPVQSLDLRAAVHPGGRGPGSRRV